MTSSCFKNYHNTGYLLTIAFIFDRCHRSLAAATPDKFERDSNIMTYTFTKYFFVTEQRMKGAFMNPTPGVAFLSWWRQQMETFSALLALGVGNSPVTGEFPAHKGHWSGALMFSMICAWINGWVNNREAGELRRHRAYYDVTVMWINVMIINSLQQQKT